MSDWGWFFTALIIGGVALLVATLADRLARRRSNGIDQPAPRRNIEAVDRQIPTYITQAEIDALPTPRDCPAALRKTGEAFSFGHAHPDFATGPQGASWDNIRVLIVDGEVTAMRLLLAPLSTATFEFPLALVAEDISDQVITTLAANRRALHMPVVASIASAQDRLRLAELLGSSQLTASDLMAGYIPESSLGRATHWSSTSGRCWVVTEDE